MESAAFLVECKSSDDGASIAWSISGDCVIAQIEGDKGERVKITTTSRFPSSSCELVCTSYNKETLFDFSVGKKIRACELCGSEWGSCKDCEGKSEECSNIDRCGVCGGDGTSCEVCSTIDSKPQQVAVDSAALNHKIFLESLIRRVSKLQRKGKLKALTPKLIKVWRALATPLYMNIWRDVWGNYQGVSRSCAVEGITSECSSISNHEAIDRMMMSASTMHSLGLTILRTLKRGGAQSTVILRYTRMNDAYHSELLNELKYLPPVVQSCWTPEQSVLICK